MKTAFLSYLLFLVLVLVSLFLFIYQEPLEQLKSLVLEGGWLGPVSFVALIILATVFAPLTVFPIIPLASPVFGWFLTSLYAVLGWGVGGLIAFFIARQWGRPLVSKLIALEQLTRYEQLVSANPSFTLVVLLRMIVPVDVLSYAVGLFSTVSLKRYALATIGIVPFAFIISYFGTAAAERNYLHLMFLVVFGTLLFFSVSHVVYRDRKN